MNNYRLSDSKARHQIIWKLHTNVIYNLEIFTTSLKIRRKMAICRSSKTGLAKCSMLLTYFCKRLFLLYRGRHKYLQAVSKARHQIIRNFTEMPYASNFRNIENNLKKIQISRKRAIISFDWKNNSLTSVLRA